MLSRRALVAALLPLGAGVVASCAVDPLQIEGEATATRGASTGATSLPTAALANIRNLDLRSTILADQRVPAPLRAVLQECARCGIDNPVYMDLTGDGADDVLVPIFDDMVQAGTVVYSVQRDTVELIFAHYGHQGTVEILDDGDLEVRTNLYAPEDAQCCPSGERLARYHWNGTRFELLSTTGDDAALAPSDPDDTVVVGQLPIRRSPSWATSSSSRMTRSSGSRRRWRWNAMAIECARPPMGCSGGRPSARSAPMSCCSM